MRVRSFFARMTVVASAMLAIIVGVGAVSAQAGMTLTYTTITLNATCDTVTINYDITNTNAGAVFMYATVVGTGAYLSETDGPANNGPNTATLSFPALASGEALQIRASVPPNIIVSGPVNCGGVSNPGPGTPIGPGNPGGNNPPPGGNSGNTPPANPNWPGYSDGRVNPDPAEAYTIFCAYDRVFVHGDLPQNRRLVAQIHIEVLMSMDDGAEYDFGSWKLSRQGNTIIIQGDNGYYRPQWRSKTFTLSNCLLNNVAGLGTYTSGGEPTNGIGFPEFRNPCAPLAVILYPPQNRSCRSITGN